MMAPRFTEVRGTTRVQRYKLNLTETPLRNYSLIVLRQVLPWQRLPYQNGGCLPGISHSRHLTSHPFVSHFNKMFSQRVKEA